MANHTDKKHPTIVRLPAHLRNKVERLAKKSHRSMQKQSEYLLEIGIEALKNEARGSQ